MDDFDKHKYDFVWIDDPLAKEKKNIFLRNYRILAMIIEEIFGNKDRRVHCFFPKKDLR